MTTIYEIRQLAGWIRAIRSEVLRAQFRGMARAVQLGERLAKSNARARFTGTRDRPKTGALMNAIFGGYDIDKATGLADGVIGVKSHKGRAGTRPYGRIHEYGGVIRPVRAKYLWQPLFGPKSSGALGDFRDMTPRKFYEAMKARRSVKVARITRTTGRGLRKRQQSQDVEASGFAIIRGISGERFAVATSRRWGKSYLTPLFLLRSSSKIPPRPYIRPAATAAHDAMPGLIAAEIAKVEPKPEGTP